MKKNSVIVKPGDILLTFESMKMEMQLVSHHQGIIKYLVQEGDLVEAGTCMIEVKDKMC